MEILPELRQPQHGRTYPACQDVEGNKLTDAEVALDDKPCSKIEHAGCHQLAHELHDLACRVAEAEHPEARGNIARKLLLPATLHLRLDRHRLERLDAGHALDQKGLVLGPALELV